MATVNDRLETKPAAITGRAAGGVIANQRANRCKRSSDAQTGEKKRKCRGNPKAQYFLEFGGAVKAEEFNEVAIGGDETLRGVHG